MMMEQMYYTQLMEQVRSTVAWLVEPIVIATSHLMVVLKMKS